MAETQSKPASRSVGFWGGFTAAAGALLAFVLGGLQAAEPTGAVPPGSADAARTTAEAIAQLVAAFGGLAAIYGRWRARGPLVGL